MIRVFVVLQVIVSIAAMVFCPTERPGSGLFNGIVSAQAALLGLWLGQGRSHPLVRLVTAFGGLVWLAVAMNLRPNFNGWILIMFVMQTVIVGGTTWRLRLCAGYVLGGPADAEERLPLQFQIRHLLLLTFLVALVLGIFASTEEIALRLHAWGLLTYGYRFLLFACTSLVGGGFALIPLAAYWGVFGRGRAGWKSLGFAVCSIMVVSALTFTAYHQTGSLLMALKWFLWSTTEAVFSVVSLWSLKRLGYRTTRRVRAGGSV